MEGQHRCNWAGSSPVMQTYHDTEWGVPPTRPAHLVGNADARRLSGRAFLGDHSAQARGLREAFVGFDPAKVARFDVRDIERLMANPGIVRAGAKIEATIKGAQIFNAMQEDGEDFAAWCWAFTDGKPIEGSIHNARTPLSALISKDLKARGFKFVGPTIVYAWMQAVGITNDHEAGCFRREEVMDG